MFRMWLRTSQFGALKLLPLQGDRLDAMTTQGVALG